MKIDDLLYMIGKLTVEREMLNKVIEQQAQRLTELQAQLHESKSKSDSPDEQEGV